MANIVFQYLLRVSHCTEDRLLLVGFEKVYRGDLPALFNLADLTIYFKQKRFYFLDPKGREKTVKNMKQVSNLIYGKTNYLR